MVQSMSIQSYDYEPNFAPEGKMISNGSSNGEICCMENYKEKE